MRNVLRGVVAAATALVGLIPGNGQALSPGVPAAGSATLAPLTGTNANTFTLTPPVGAACPGDSATGGYRWQTFMTAAAIDPATLTYTLTGPVVQGTEFSKPLFSNFGAPQVNKITAVTTGLLTPIPLFGWDASILPVPNGEYNIGYACTTAGTTQRFWSTPITVSNSTASTFSYRFGAKPAAPVLSSPLVAGDHTLAGSFTSATSMPAATGFTVVAVPSAGTTVSLPVAAAGAFVLSGLENAVSYSVSVVATNALGDSLPSNTVQGTPSKASPSFVPLTPARLVDTRSGAKVGNAAGTGAPLVVKVFGKGGLPGSGIGAVSLNVTVADGGLPDAGGGYVTVYPCGTRPNASNLNFGAGQTIPNAVIAPVSASGDVCFYVYGTAHLLVDVAGYFPTGTGFTPLSPARLADTRSGARVGNAAGTGAPLVVNVFGKGGLPGSGIGAVSLNVTVADGGLPDVGGGFVTVYPCGTRPDASNLNFGAGQTIPNAVIAPVSASGDVCFYVYGTAHLLVDVAGYFPTGTGFTPLNPARLADTRSGARVGNAAGTGAPLVVNVFGKGGLPGSGIGAVSLNVTVADGGLPDVGGGFVTVYPCGTRPDASNLNFGAGQTIPNAVIAPVSASGDVCFYVYGTAHLLVDVSAYFSATTS